MIKCKGLSTLTATFLQKGRVVFPAQIYSTDTAILVHLQSRGSSGLLFNISLHTSPAPPLAHFWTIFKLPVKWICIAFAVNPFARQNDNEEKVLSKNPINLM